MAFMLYNTQTRTKEIFKPLKKKVRLYTCGPTVYDFAHIGNFRAYVCGDILKRYLRFLGFPVKHVMNLTDVDDKTIHGSIREGISLQQYTQKYETAFFEDLEKLNIDKADIFPRATEHIPEMVALIKNLLKKKVAYPVADGSIYFDISKFKGYGKLSHIQIKGLKAGARVKQDQYEKEEAQDFALWKAHSAEDGSVFWETSLGKGRPGWHIECSAMSVKYLGQPFDIHAGGIDLVFPHHENEISQSEAANGKPLARYWFHNEHLLVNGKKMSKSLNNFFTLRDLLAKGHDAKAIRYFLLSAHYRQQLNLTEEGLEAAGNAVERLQTLVSKLQGIKGADSKNTNNEKRSAYVQRTVKKAEKEFVKRMDNDLNISEALAVLFDAVKAANKRMESAGLSKADARLLLKFLESIDSILGVLTFSEEKIPPGVIALAKQREKARLAKDYKTSDELRAKIQEKGYLIEDTDTGPQIKRM